MVNAQELYRQKLVTAEEAVKTIKSGDHLVFPVGAGEPQLLPEALVQRKDQLEDVIISQILSIRKATYMQPEYTRHIRHNSWFASGATRQGVNEGWMDFAPNYFHEVPRLIEQNLFPVDVLMATVSSMDNHGFFSFSCGVDYTTTAAKKAKTIILEVNPNAPRTMGNCFIHISDVTYVVENDAPMPEMKILPITPTEEAIGGYVAELIENGSTIQIGFGGIPNAVTQFLLKKHDLGIHTEMITDGMVDLLDSGAVNNKKKALHPGKIIGTFALGTKRLYQFLHDNPIIEMHPVSYTNDPYVIGQNNKMVAVNAAIEVDLLGQCASETIGTMKWSGTGGQADFGRGVNISPGGKGFITLPSTAKNGTISRIVPVLNQGAAVTTSKNTVDHVVTEFGVAKLRGKTARQRAHALIAIAHPDYRGELTEAAKKISIL
ncbi:MAG: acetyl-CoA hydrolase/transferase family protein [Thermincolia bacterium]